jgi:hypothetical protein
MLRDKLMLRAWQDFAGPDLVAGRERPRAFFGGPSAANPGATQGRALQNPSGSSAFSMQGSRERFFIWQP